MKPQISRTMKWVSTSSLKQEMTAHSCGHNYTEGWGTGSLEPTMLSQDWVTQQDVWGWEIIFKIKLSIQPDL